MCTIITGMTKTPSYLDLNIRLTECLGEPRFNIAIQTPGSKDSLVEFQNIPAARVRTAVQIYLAEACETAKLTKKMYDDSCFDDYVKEYVRRHGLNAEQAAQFRATGTFQAKAVAA